MRRGKKTVSVGIILCLLCGFSAQAVELIPPPPFAELSGTTASTTQERGPGVTGNQSPTQSQSQTQSTQTAAQSTTEAKNDRNSGPGVTTTQATVNRDVPVPNILSEGAVLMDAATGEFLYEKNSTTRYFPASVTKLMTALLVTERCGLDDTVTFSASATTNLEYGATTAGIVAGDKLSVRQSLYALLLKSANEVANGLAEHTAGSNDAFVNLMNEKARALGCEDTNFANPNGLNSSLQYTTPRDMALITKAAFENETVRTIAGTLTYRLPATKKASARTITMGHKMLNPSDSRYYEGILGGKTGYTSLAGNTMATVVERNGVRLIVVVLKSSSTHYEDTKALLDYGFEVKLGAGTTAETRPEETLPAETTPAETTPAETTPAETSPTETSPVETTSAETQATTGWIKDDTGWYYIKSDGSRANAEILAIDGEDYWFDDTGYMAVGWRKGGDGNWYYMRRSGIMAKNYWAQDRGTWFYLGETGAILKGGTTPDGYQVGKDGVWLP